MAAAIAAATVIMRAVSVRLPIPGLNEHRAEDARFLAALEAGGSSALSVAATTAAAGLIVWAVTLTGPGRSCPGSWSPCRRETPS